MAGQTLALVRHIKHPQSERNCKTSVNHGCHSSSRIIFGFDFTSEIIPLIRSHASHETLRLVHLCPMCVAIFIVVPCQQVGRHTDVGRKWACPSVEVTHMSSRRDNVGARTLSSASYANSNSMTVESCISFCSPGSNSYIYAGVEYADECCESRVFCLTRC